MAKDLTNTSGNYLSSNDDFYAALAAEAQTLKGGGDGKAFLKFNGNDGEFTYGADDEELPLKSRLAVNMKSYQRGWVIWVDGEVIHEEMALFPAPAPTKAGLPDKGPYGEDDGPVEQYTIDFKMLDDPHVEMVFQANNSSKRRAMAALLKDFANGFKLHPGCVPVIEIDEREFETKTKGGKGRKITKHAPVFKIVDWMPETELAAMSEGAPEDYEDEKPARGRGAKALPASKDEEEDERPARRSRRAEAEPEEEDERPARRTARREEPEAEEDERPARRTRREEPEPEADEDEKPARRTRRDPEPEPEEEEDERPARRSARREEPEEDEDERPARRSARREEPEEEEDERPARRRAARDEDDAEEEAPRRRGRF